jgi:hypothetical protein
MNKHLNVLTHMGLMESPNLVASCVNMESPNLVASCVDGLGDTLPCFTGVQWDSVQATHSVSVEAYVWKTALGQGRTRLDSLTAL